MNFFSALDILAAGLGAERVRMNVTSSNLANARTTRTAKGGPYLRRDPVFSAQPVGEDPFADELATALRRVDVDGVVTDSSKPRLVFDPSHPDANRDGYVSMPNVNVIEEMVNMVTAARSYEAGVTAMRSLVQMAERALNLGK